MTTDTISVPEIHCDHCKRSIEDALNPVNGVREALVDVEARNVTVTYEEQKVRRHRLVELIEEQGYEVPVS